MIFYHNLGGMTVEGELEQIRAELDRIDKELVELFRARMELSGRAAEYKRDHNLPVLAAGQERELLSRVSGREMSWPGMPRCCTRLCWR